MLLPGLLDLFKRKRLLFTLVASFLAASVVSVVLVSGILFAVYNRRSMEDLAAVTQLRLAETANRLEQTITQAADIAYLIFKEPDVVSLMYAHPEDPLTLVRVTSFVQNLMISDPYIDSVSLCGKDSVILSTSQGGDAPEDPTSVLNLARQPNALTPRPRRLERGHGTPSALLTLTINESNAPSYVDSAVVLNLNADAIRRDLAPDSPGLQTIVVTDAAGTVLLGPDAGGFGGSIAQQPYVKRLFADARSTGFFLADMGSRQYAVAFAKVADGHYTAISLTDYVGYTAGIVGLRNLLFAVSGGILLAVLAFGFFVSLRLYLPLNSLFDGVRSRIAAYPRPRGSEVEYVSRILARAMDAFRVAEQSLDNDRVVVSALVRDLLTGPAGLDAHALEEELRRRNAAADKPGRFSVAVLRLDGFASLREKTPPETLRFQMASIGGIAAETLRGRAVCTPTQTADDLVALLLSVPESSVSWWQGHGQASLRTVQGAVHKMLGLSTTAALGGEVLTIAEARPLYRSVEALTHYRLALSTGVLVTPESVRGFRDEPIDGRSVEETFRALARSPDREAFATGVDGLVKRCRVLCIDHQLDAFAAAARAVLTSGVGITSADAGAQAPGHGEAAVRQVESYDEVKALLLSLYDANQALLRDAGTSRSADFLHKVVEFIDRHFADSQLSANMLAEKLAITPQYFSRLFNESVGSSFPEYLMRLRLEKARALLLATPRLTVDEVCRQIGLHNRTYFATAFKKRFGLTPAAFRHAGASASLAAGGSDAGELHLE